MNHFVPDFEAEDDYSIPTSSSRLNLPKKSAMAEDDIMELMWHNGQVVAQSQRSHKKPSLPSKPTAEQSTAAVEPRGSSDYPHLFMQEDEMASWLQYPLHDDDFCSDLLYQNPHAAPSVSHAQESVSFPAAQTSGSRAPPPPSVSCSPLEEAAAAQRTMATSKPPILPAPPGRRTESDSKAVRNFGHFSRLKGINSRMQSSSTSVSKTVVREPSPAARSETVRRTETVSGGAEATGRTMGISAVAVGGASSSSAFREARSKDLAREVSVSSSSGEAVLKQPLATPLEDRKRKGRETDEIESQSEDVKQAHGSSSTKRSRAAEVHNLSERRRRDRINEKMRALQELIPRCNKSDKASMLDEAIEYLKSLQLQVQMMSMGCGMVPMMYPAVQQYMPQHLMMGLGMDMGMNRPIMPFPNVLAGSTIQPPVHLGGPRFPVPPFPMPGVHPSDPNRVQMVNQPAEQMTNSFAMQNPNQTNIPGYPDPYQQFLGLQMQIPPPTMQNQATDRPSSSKPNTGKEPENPENHQSG